MSAKVTSVSVLVGDSTFFRVHFLSGNGRQVQHLHAQTACD